MSSPCYAALEIGRCKGRSIDRGRIIGLDHQRFPNLRNFAFQEEYLGLPKENGAHFDEKYLWDQLRPIIPYPTGRFFRRTLSQALRASAVWTFARPSNGVRSGI